MENLEDAEFFTGLDSEGGSWIGMAQHTDSTDHDDGKILSLKLGYDGSVHIRTDLSAKGAIRALRRVLEMLESTLPALRKVDGSEDD